MPELVARAASCTSRAASSCHGADGGGHRPRRRPSSASARPAPTSTCRRAACRRRTGMPYQPTRKQPAYTPRRDRRPRGLRGVARPGPAIPSVDTPVPTWPRAASLFRANCASCHQSAGTGGALSATGSRRRASSNATADAGRGGDAHRARADAGVQRQTIAPRRPTTSPPTSSTCDRPTTAAASPLGGIGPVTEGLVALAGRPRRHPCVISVWIVGDARTEPDDASPADRRPTARGTPMAPPPRSSSPSSAALGLAVVYWRGGQPQVEGVLLAVVLGGIGAGIVALGAALHAARPVRGAAGPDRVRPRRTSPRSSTTSSGAARASPGGASSPRWPPAPSARLGLAALFPIRSLGPRPGSGLKETRLQGEAASAWSPSTAQPVERRRPGRRRRPHRATRRAHVGDADSPTLLIHLAPGQEQADGRDARRGPPGDLVAYSKLCTAHGLPGRPLPGRKPACCCARATSRPSTSPTAATRSSGPATRSLPQLPIAIDADGLPRRHGRLQRPGRSGVLGRGHD